MKTGAGAIGYAEWENAARVIQESMVFRCVSVVARGYLAGAQSSPIAAYVRRASDACRMLAPVSRLRSIALTVGVTAVAHQLLVGLVPPGSAPRLPRALDVIVAAVALAAIAGAGPLLTASRSSFVLRWLWSRPSLRPELTGGRPPLVMPGGDV